jgi:hypothetical protein
VAKRGEVTGECRKLHDEELYILFSAQGIVEMNKCKRTRYVLHIERMGTSSIRIDGCSWANRLQKYEVQNFSF